MNYKFVWFIVLLSHFSNTLFCEPALPPNNTNINTAPVPRPLTDKTSPRWMEGGDDMFNSVGKVPEYPDKITGKEGDTRYLSDSLPENRQSIKERYDACESLKSDPRGWRDCHAKEKRKNAERLNQQRTEVENKPANDPLERLPGAINKIEEDSDED